MNLPAVPRTPAFAPAPMGPAGAERAGPPLPWWRVGMVWLVISGPAAVVVAGFATLAIAMHGADPVLRVDASRTPADAPAVQARNHAATGGLKAAR